MNNFVHPLLRFNNNNVSQASSQKHLGLTLDNRLTFNEHLTNVSNKIKYNHRIATEITEYLTKARTYGDIIYDQAYNLSFHQKLESIQYNAALVLTGAIRGT